MRDTPPDVDAMYRAMVMALSPEQRLLMVFDMYNFALELVRASIVQARPKATEAEIRQQIFLRFYRDDFTSEQLEVLLARIARRSGASTEARSTEAGSTHRPAEP